MAWIRFGVAIVFFSLGASVFGDDIPKPDPKTPQTTPDTPAPKPKFTPQKEIVSKISGKLSSIDKDKVTITLSSQQSQGKNKPPKTVTKDMTYDMAEVVRVKLVRTSGDETTGSMADVEKGQTVQLDFSEYKEKDENGKTQKKLRVSKIEVSTDAKKKPATP